MSVNIYDDLYEAGLKRAKHVIWVFSDLQQAKFTEAERCLSISMSDYESLGCPAEMIWYLGDSTQGADLNELNRMTDLQERAFVKLGVPVCYASGNHEYDYAEYCHRNGGKEPKMPFFEMVKKHDTWHTTETKHDTWFKISFDEYTVYFFCDHVAEDNSWCSTHNGIRWGAENYPYGQEHFDEIREDMKNCGSRYIITCAHCAFPGGNRETGLLQKIQPLPLNTLIHLYGHAHLGEYRCPKERVFSQIQWVDWQDIPQVDIASFEDVRGSYCRSVILQIYNDGQLGLFFRNHNIGHFVSAFFPRSSSAEIPGNFEKKEELSKW